MKKIFALAFVAGMVTFAACTSKPADEAADTTTVTSVETPTVDSTATTDSTTMSTDTTASDSIK
ncbi:hypothetical protein [Dyadobacter sediminis]|uniref:Entericidin n=1 Tax=Dyadobacter sediminis TaxID=1493691 RepID=A0A5R9K8D4_9BACT|nr:hypothetical protein [Dyadobacter sediminis]TLU90349.1 hypothetical protein FEM55_17435 [Dyadobacter sediminis]GGC07059.1 hypothetical protein GCM10011325_37410 [Dyadobacter sediminis]